MAQTNQNPDEYEFTDVHNLIFDGLARAMKVVGIAFFALAAVSAFYAVRAAMVYNTPDVVVGVLELIVSVAMGLFTTRAASSVRLVVTTEGDDIPHLMAAVGELKRLFTVQTILAAVLVALFSYTMYNTDPAPKADDAPAKEPAKKKSGH